MKLSFSIRDLLWLTALAAVLVAWWIDRTRLNAEVERLTPQRYHWAGSGSDEPQF